MDLSSQGIGGGVEGVALRKRDLAKTTMTETWPMDMSANDALWSLGPG